MSMDALIMAGGTPQPDDPLYEKTGGLPKALLEINGRSLLSHVLQALQEATSIDHILIVGLDAAHVLIESDKVHLLPDQGGMVQNGLAGLQWLKQHRQQRAHVALVSVDIPFLTGAIVDAVIANCQPFDAKLYYHFVTHSVMERRFPGSLRTFVKLKGNEIAGADFSIVHTDLSESNGPLWEALTNGRKQAWKLARVVGWGVLFKFLFRRLSVPDIATIATRIIGQPVEVVLSPYAEIGMDIDKVEHFDMIQDYGK